LLRPGPADFLFRAHSWFFYQTRHFIPKIFSLQKAFNQDISPPRPGESFQFNLLNLKRAKPVFLPLLLSFAAGFQGKIS